MNEQQYIETIRASRSERTFRHFSANVEERRDQSGHNELSFEELDGCLTRAVESTVTDASPGSYPHCKT